LGYLTVSGDGRFEVGRRLKEDFENGRQRPSPEVLEWHQTNRFLG
jgi:hypothetical protein